METKILLTFSILFILLLSTSLAHAEDNSHPPRVPKPLTWPKEGTTLLMDRLRAKRALFNVDGITARGHPSGHSGK
uniref:Uncharacterized protein n=1 Tax=Panagrolaimus sp. ES5 TaxID=591445 RepID=A0AC34FFL2_9BILA